MESRSSGHIVAMDFNPSAPNREAMENLHHMKPIGGSPVMEPNSSWMSTIGIKGVEINEYPPNWINGVEINDYPPNWISGVEINDCLPIQINGLKSIATIFNRSRGAGFVRIIDDRYVGDAGDLFSF